MRRAGAARAAARLGPARDRRLLDPRRLPQLGHRPRLLSLAPAQEDRAGAARADRRRRATRAPARRAVGRVGQVAARPRAHGLRRAGRARADGSRRRSRTASTRFPRVAPTRTSPPPARRPTRTGRSRRGSAAGPRSRPPALYSFDPDTGRLAVTTPAYNTAIVPVNQCAIPYGGLDIARLFDGRQEVAGEHRRVRARGLRPDGSGERPRAARHPVRGPGLRGRRHAAAAHARSARRRRDRGHHAAARLRRAVHRPARDRDGERSRAARHDRVPLHPGVHRRPLATARRSRRGRAVTFPSWGRGARVQATLSDGSTVRLGRAPLEWARVRSLEITSERSGYRVTPLGAARGSGAAGADRPAAVSAQPGPGRRGHARARARCSLAARITVR